MAHTQGADYYTRRQDELLSDFDRESGRWQPLLAGRYGSLEAAAMLGNARARFEALIPELPYIGGDENHLTGALVDSARCLALFLAMRHRNHTAADTGRILYDAVRARAGEPRPQIPPAECLSREALMARRRRGPPAHSRSAIRKIMSTILSRAMGRPLILAMTFTSAPPTSSTAPTAPTSSRPITVSWTIPRLSWMAWACRAP